MGESMTSDHAFAPLWSTDDLAAFLKLPAKTIRDWRHKGTGPKYARLGKHVRYNPADVLEWIKNSGHDHAA